MDSIRKSQGIRQRRTQYKIKSTSSGRRDHKHGHSDSRRDKERNHSQFFNLMDYEVSYTGDVNIGYHFDHEEDDSTFLRKAILKKDKRTVNLLLNKGCFYACDDCYECGWPETCTLLTSMTTNSISIFKSLIKFSKFNYVVHSLEMYIGDENFIEETAREIIRIIIVQFPRDKIKIKLPFPFIKSLKLKMDSFVCFLMKNEFVDLEYIISDQVSKLISFIWDPDDICELVDTIKTVIDMGCDTRKPIVFSRYDGEVLSTLEDLLNMRYDIISDLRSNPIIVLIFSRLHTDINSMCEIFIREMCGLQKYIGYKMRLCFIGKRVRGFSESDEPTEFDKKFINMETELFSRVLCFL